MPIIYSLFSVLRKSDHLWVTICDQNLLDFLVTLDYKKFLLKYLHHFISLAPRKLGITTSGMTCS